MLLCLFSILIHLRSEFIVYQKVPMVCNSPQIRTVHVQSCMSPLIPDFVCFYFLTVV